MDLKMKVYEIISERKESINETVASSLFGGGVGLLAKALGKSDKKLAIEALAKFFDKNTGKIVAGSRAEFNAINAAKQQYGDKIIKSAESLAIKNAKEAKFAADTASISNAWNSAKSALGKTYSFGKTIANLAMTQWWWKVVLEPFNVYLDELQSGQEAVDNHEPNWTPEYFEEYRKQRTAVLIGKVAEQIIIKKFTFGIMTRLPVIGKYLTPLIPAAEAHFMDYVNSPEGSKQVATVMIAPVLTGTIGGLGTYAVDKLKGKYEEAKSAITGTPNSNASVASNTSKPTEQPTTATNTPTTQQSTGADTVKQPSRWSSSSSPSTGDIYVP